MFDVAYLAEANIFVAESEKARLWNCILGCSDRKNKFSLGFSLARFSECLLYWSFIFYTHGGI